MRTISILLADDHTIVREGLRALLEFEKDLQVIGEAGDGRTAVKLVLELRPDVVVMDIAMPLLNGIEASRQILHELPDAKILILSAHRDDVYVEQTMKFGVKGYLIKQTASSALAEAIRRVHHGETCLSPSVSDRLHYHEKKARAHGELHAKENAARLSSREVEVLQLIAEGKANKETADILQISVKTVEKHRQNVMDKLNVHDTAGLTRYAIANGIIESSVQVTIL